MIPLVTILLSDAALAAPPEPSGDAGLHGAVLDFHGVVRCEENGDPISALEYQAYQPMAASELERIARELLAQFPCLEVYIAHRFGIVPVGEAAIVIRVTGRHREETFSFVTNFMERLKADVPIWKMRAIPAHPLAPC